MNEPEDWAKLERLEHEQYQRNYRWWRLLIILWILASVGVFVLTVAVKLYNAMRGG